MNIWKDFQKNPMKYFKITGLLLIGLVVLSILAATYQSGGFPDPRYGRLLNQAISSVSHGAPAYDYDDGYYAEQAVMEESKLSARNIAPPPQAPGTTGADAEEFEVTEYNTRIETRDKEETCKTILDLKSDTEIIFEDSYEYDNGCSFNIKVKNNRVEEVLAIIKDLDPRDLDENTYTIKQLVDDYTSEIEILEAKKESIESTLEDALTAYDEVTQLASNTNDVETLAKVIDSKINTIEKLTQQRIFVNEQLDRIQRSKAQQLDRIDYTYFSVQVTENKYIDIDDLKDSWRTAVRVFVHDINEIAQGISIGLIYLLLLLVQYAFYLVILLVVAKYGWRLIKDFWRK